MFKCQFSVESQNPDFDKVEYHALEGFLPNQVESLERLVQRISVGQIVPTIDPGIYASDQIFETELVDKFDVLDKADELGDAILAERQKPSKQEQETQPEKSSKDE